jgi:hypothetical protein
MECSVKVGNGVKENQRFSTSDHEEHGFHFHLW